MLEIKEGDLVLARHISEGDFKRGLNFFSQDSEFIQVGFWDYDKGKKLLAHAHNEVPREVGLTQEVLFVKRGKIRARIYDSKQILVREFEVLAGDILIAFRGAHGYDILEDGTQVLEVKNGPYLGAEVDRVRIENE